MTAIPLRKPTRTGFDKNCARTPRRAKPAAMHSAPMSSASIEASATALAGSARASTSGTSAAAISGPSAESGPKHEDAGGSEQRVRKERQHRRVQAGDGGKPGQLGVRHALRDEQRGEHHPGDDVPTEPRPPVGAHQVHSRHRHGLDAAPHTLERGHLGSRLRRAHLVDRIGAAGPYPPPPGVATTSTSPACASIESAPAMATMLPSARSRKWTPSAPGEPPAMP